MIVASVLELDRAAMRTLRVTDPYSIHRVVYSLYAPPSEGEPAHGSGRILYADQGGDFSSRRILMLSNRMPAASVDGTIAEVRSKVVAENFFDYGHFRFKVAVNAVMTALKDGSRMPIRGREAIADWFIQSAEPKWGFAVSAPHLQVGQTTVLRFNDKHGHPVTLSQAQVEGHLVVKDREKFRNSFTNGIGRGRAFGCGLLQMAPIIDNPFF